MSIDLAIGVLFFLVIVLALGVAGLCAALFEAFWERRNLREYIGENTKRCNLLQEMCAVNQKTITETVGLLKERISLLEREQSQFGQIGQRRDDNDQV